MVIDGWTTARALRRPRRLRPQGPDLNWFLTNEIGQLESWQRFMPTVFLAVAAFLTNMVLARLIAIERGRSGC